MDPRTQDGAPGAGAPGEYRAVVRDSAGTQFGDGNVQINLFGDRTPSDPVVAGNVPREPPAFQPRAELMAQLCAHGPGVSVVRAVTGMRGVGKTQLAAAYARQCIDAGWRLVAWVNAEDTASLLAGLEVVANRLGIDRPGTALEAIGAEVRNRVEADGDRCLVVFDNVTDPGTLGPYLPSAGKSHVVVTSTAEGALALGRHTPVAVFSAAESLDFLAERTRRDDAAGAKLLAAELGHLPLALAQAAAVIRARRLSYQVYLSRLRAYPARQYLPPAKGDPYPRGVAESILLSIDTATATDGTGMCQDLLGVISLLSPDGVARDLLYLGETEDAFGVGAETIDEALASLADASLLAFGGDDESSPTVTAHRLVTRVARERAAHDETLIALGAKACALLTSAALALGEPWRRREAARDLVQHVIALHDHLAPADGTGAKSLTEAVLNRRGWALWCLNDLADSLTQAIAIGEPLVTDQARMLGDTHQETLTSRNNLAHAYRAAGRLDEAIPQYERTLADLVLLLGEGHPDTLMSRSNLAVAYRAAGRVDEAVPLYERTLGDRVRVLGEGHPDTLTSRNNLAVAYRAAGRVDEAIPLYERTLADCVRVLDEGHPDTLMSRNNLAYGYRAAGRLDEAIPLFEQALTGLERVLGAEHPMTVTVRRNLADAREAATRSCPETRRIERRERKGWSGWTRSR
jgi:tetratricopeptide (TPR) repeat protein